MRIILIIVIFIFSLQSLTKAEKVTDFVIEGISVGDSFWISILKNKLIDFLLLNIHQVRNLLDGKLTGA